MQFVDKAGDDRSLVAMDDDLCDLSTLYIPPILSPSGSEFSGGPSRSCTEGEGAAEVGDPSEEPPGAFRAAKEHHKPRKENHHPHHQQQHRHHRQLHHHRSRKGSTEESQHSSRGMLYKAIPIMPLWLAVTCCCLNIIIPGTGTLVSAFCLLCGLSRPNQRHGQALPLFLLNIVTSLLQLLTFAIIVGWIWSIIWGMTFVQLAIAVASSRGRGSLEPSSIVVPYYVRRHSSVS